MTTPPPPFNAGQIHHVQYSKVHADSRAFRRHSMYTRICDSKESQACCSYNDECIDTSMNVQTRHDSTSQTSERTRRVRDW